MQQKHANDCQEKPDQRQLRKCRDLMRESRRLGFKSDAKVLIRAICCKLDPFDPSTCLFRKERNKA